MQQQRFISFEGIDFSGKSSQVQLLLKRLQEQQLPVHLLREPGGTAVSERIRAIVLDPDHPELHARSEILLYSAARAQVVQEGMLPMLEQGHYLIADRFFDSTTAYQGYGRGLDIDFVQQLNHFATAGLLPGRTYFIDISVEEAMRRRRQAGRSADRLEQEAVGFYRRIREAYHLLLQENPQRFRRIEGEGSIEEIAEVLWRDLCNFWELPG